MGSSNYDTSGEGLLGSCKYDSVKALKRLYRNYYNLEKLAGMGHQAAIAVVLDLRLALDPKKRILTKKQLFAVVYVLINSYTLEDASKIIGCTPHTIQIHVDSGIKRIKDALNNGDVYRNRYEIIRKEYGITPLEQLAKKLDMKENTIKSIYHRLKKEGEVNG